MSAIKELARAVNRIAELSDGDNRHGRGIANARTIHASTMNRLNNVQITAKNDYNRDPYTEDVEAAKAIREGLRDQYDQAGRQAQYEAITAIADEIMELQRVLSGLAGKATVEAWAIARDIYKEAEQP